MPLTIGDTAPDFTAQTTEGEVSFHEWIGDDWAVLFSHPRAFTPVCTTELGYMASIQPEFEKRGAKIIAISTDPAEDSKRWAVDIEKSGGTAVNYPIIGDDDHAVSKAYGMLPSDVSGPSTERTPAQNATLRNVFVIGPDKQIKLVLVYPMTTGRNFDEILRVIDSLQLTATHQLTTPAQWQQGEDVILAGGVTDEVAKERYPEGWETPLPYMRVVPAPQSA
ncbi:MAG: peroxiredoxin [Solirubrobacterales bacterium]